MKDRVERLFKIYDEAIGLASDLSIEADFKRMEKVMSGIYLPGPSFQAVYDLPTKSFTHIGIEVTEIIGYPKEMVTMEMLVNNVHPDDVEQLIKNEALSTYFFNEFIDQEQKLYYKATHQYRLLDRFQKYKLLLVQEVLLTLDEQGKISKSLINFSDISSFAAVGNSNISFIDIRGIKSYTNVEVEIDLHKNRPGSDTLSSREIEILHLVSEGYNSKEIADMLYISYDTVRTHRNNIVTKNNFKSINQAVAYFIRKGVL